MFKIVGGRGDTPSGSFIAQQPNGLYCRFSSVVDCLTHINMTAEDYISNFTGTVKSKEEAEKILEHHVRSFSAVQALTRDRNISPAVWKRTLTHVTLPKNSIFVYAKEL